MRKKRSESIIILSDTAASGSALEDEKTSSYLLKVQFVMLIDSPFIMLQHRCFRIQARRRRGRAAAEREGRKGVGRETPWHYPRCHRRPVWNSSVTFIVAADRHQYSMERRFHCITVTRSLPPKDLYSAEKKTEGKSGFVNCHS